MLFSDADGRKIVSTTTADTVGKVHDYVVDPAGPTVAAVLVKKAEGDTLRWTDIKSFGADAVTVESADVITKGGDDLSALLEKRNRLHKKRMLTTVGDEIGSVRDIDFDPATGTVTAFVLDNGDQVAGTRLVGVGSWAVVVQAETASAAGESAPAAAARPAPVGEPVSTEPPRPSADLSKPDLSAAERASYPPS